MQPLRAKNAIGANCGGLEHRLVACGVFFLRLTASATGGVSASSPTRLCARHAIRHNVRPRPAPWRTRPSALRQPTFDASRLLLQGALPLNNPEVSNNEKFSTKLSEINNNFSTLSTPQKVVMLIQQIVHKVFKVKNL